jgi:hypothetical protein
MIIEEERGGELRGRYIGYRGNEVAGGLRGRLKLPDVVFTLQDTDFTLTLTNPCGSKRTYDTQGV